MIFGKKGEGTSFSKMIIAIIIFILVLIVTVVVLIYLRSIDETSDEGLFEGENRDASGDARVSGSGDESINFDNGGSDGLTPPPVPS